MIDYLLAKKLIECNPMKFFVGRNIKEVREHFLTLLFILKKDDRFCAIAKELDSPVLYMGMAKLPKPTLIMLFEITQSLARRSWNNLSSDISLANYRHRFFSDRVDFPENWRDL